MILETMKWTRRKFSKICKLKNRKKDQNKEQEWGLQGWTHREIETYPVINEG